MDEVGERRAHAAQEAGHADRHPQLLRAGEERDRLDPLRYERRIAGDRGESQVGCRAGQLAQQLGHVGLVPGSMPTEHVGINEH